MIRKLAVIDHIGNPGGGSRVVRALLPAFRTLRPDIEITYFGNPISIKRESITKEFSSINITVKSLRSVWLSNVDLFGIKGISYIFRVAQQRYGDIFNLLPTILSGAVHKEVERIAAGYDLVFFPWPYLLKCPNLSCPIVGIFHDFNYRYYFNGNYTFNTSQIQLVDSNMPIWLNKSTPIVSTYFMESELKKFYPDYSHKVKVVHLAPMSTKNIIEKAKATNTLTKFGINKKYILYPTNTCSHKNIGPLLAALYILNRKGKNISLVITGPGTEVINGKACDIGIEICEVDKDVYGLGYVTNLQMDSLIQCASVVVSTSLYEAGNGPGVDAWALGVPVAMSNIPAFLEHIKVQDVKAEVFDPRNPFDIAEKINNILSNPDRATADAIHSQEAINKYTWLRTAKKYLEIFDESIKVFSKER